MNYVIVLLLVVASIFSSANSVKIAVLNDIHYEPFYEDDADPTKYCKKDDPFGFLQKLTLKSVEKSPFGHYNCDSPKKLVDLMLKKLKNVDPDVDVILVSGDFLAHGFAAHIGTKDHYDLLKQTLKYVFVDLLAAHFPNAIILPAIGNNDIKFHYRAPSQDDDAVDYYTFLADVLFNQVSGNSKIKTDLIKQTFLYKGYYRYDYETPTSDDDSRLSFLSFNSLYYNLKAPSMEVDIMKTQLDWLEQQLSTAEDNRKFILFLHIFPGEYHEFQATYFWDEDSTNRFRQIVQKHNDRIVIMLGAHTHFAGIRADIGGTPEKSGSFLKAQESNVPKLALLITPSISPTFYNNPGVTTFRVEQNQARGIQMHFFELNQFPETEEAATFNMLDFESELGIDVFNVTEVGKFLQMIEGSWVYFYRYLAHVVGYRGLTEVLGIGLYYELGQIGLTSRSVFMCSSKHMDKEDFEKCIKS